MNGSDMILTLVFLGLAIFVIMKLRSVLGQRTGFERPPEVIRREMEGRAAAQGGDNVVALPRGDRPMAEPAAPTFRWEGVAEPGSRLAEQLDAIAKADPDFDARTFTEGAKAAYEMIVVAFARGDRKLLRDLLAKDVFDGFMGVVTQRETLGQTADTTFVSIDRAAITDAELKGRTAQVTVSFDSKIITVTRGKDGTVVDGDPQKVVDVNDVWTFARDTTSRDPNWRLIGT